MDILSKFAAVEVKSVQRITQEDQKFCKTQQAAYESAKAVLSELHFFWEDALQTQGQILADTDTPKTQYLTGYDELKISPEKIQDQAHKLHTTFIQQLVSYFNHLYRITLSSTDIAEKLIPQPPKYQYSYEKKEEHYIKEYEKYLLHLSHLSLTSEDILEEIFSQMDGRGLAEQALYELKSKCHDAAWSDYHKTSKYELHKDILRFTGYACSHSDYRSSSPWELSSGLKDVLRGIAHFETDTFSYIPEDILKLLSYSYSYDLTTFPNCKKVKQLKMFKNGRVDIKFSDAELAKKFTEDYLGTVY